MVTRAAHEHSADSDSVRSLSACEAASSRRAGRDASRAWCWACCSDGGLACIDTLSWSGIAGNASGGATGADSILVTRRAVGSASCSGGSSRSLPQRTSLSLSLSLLVVELFSAAAIAASIVNRCSTHSGSS